MHSSRMRTGRSLTVCWRLLPRGVSAPGGVCSWGCLLGWGVVSQHALRQTLPPVDRITDACKKHYLDPTSLPPVIMLTYVN